jgi:hypothetical protein
MLAASNRVPQKVDYATRAAGHKHPKRRRRVIVEMRGALNFGRPERH